MSRTLMATLLAVSGCANFSVERVTERNKDRGLHFFLPKPHVLIWWEKTATTRGTTTNTVLQPKVEVVYLPDPEERFTITQWAVLSKADFSYKLKNGWQLESIGGKTDTTAALEFLQDTAKIAADAAARLAAAPPETVEKVPPPRLYELRWDPEKRAIRFQEVAFEPAITAP